MSVMKLGKINYIIKPCDHNNNSWVVVQDNQDDLLVGKSTFDLQEQLYAQIQRVQTVRQEH